MQYILVATDSQTGSKTIKGPITGRDWLVTSQGNWIVDEFERDDRALKLEVDRYCFRTRSMIKTKIHLLVPSWDQLEMMPEELEV